ncbi:MAG: hypothetical protein M3P87_06025, partial [Actinomycetota bacterium]|nr:hypothetical protein [Actinomycetota bacterium]
MKRYRITRSQEALFDYVHLGGGMAKGVEHRAPIDGVTEIRIHGVGGASPTTSLGRPDAVQVTGDKTAGFFRAPTLSTERTVEAYSWGGLTARSRTRALWVLLLPFALLNLAGWMIEPDQRHPDATEDISRLIRWLRSRVDKLRPALLKIQKVLIHLTALIGTVLVIGWVAFGAIDVLAFKCVNNLTCRTQRPYIEWFDGLVDQPGQRLAIAAALPIAVILLFASLSFLSRSRYEDFYIDGTRDQTILTTDLREPGFWQNNRWVNRLFRIHVGGAFLLLGGLILYTLSELVESPGTTAPAWVVAIAATGFWMAVGLGVLALVALSAMVLLEQSDSVGPKRLIDSLGRAVLLGGVGLCALSIVALASVSSIPEQLGLPGFGEVPIVALAAGFVAIVLFSVIQVVRWVGNLEIRPGQFLIVFSGLMVVAWQWAIWIAAISTLLAVFAYLVEVGSGRRPPRSDYLVPVGLTWLFPFVELVGGRLGLDVGVAWPRTTPLAIAVIVVAVSWSLEARREESSLWVRVAPLLLGGSLAGAGWAGTALGGPPVATWGGLVTAWMVISFAIIAVHDVERFRWNGAGAVALFALTMLSAIGSGALIRFAALGGTSGILVSLSTVHEWVAVGFSAVLLLGVAGFVSWVVVVRLDRGRKVRQEMAALAGDIPDEVRLSATQERRLISRVGRMTSLSSSLGAVDVFLTLTSMTLIFAAAALVIEGVWGSANPFRPVPMSGWTNLVSWSSWLLLTTGLGAVLITQRAFGNSGMRRNVGILWDVAGFWPRQFHPFAPPSYASRTVPELQARIQEIADLGGGSIVSGHSQGSVVAFATVASLPDSCLHRVRLVTHGSPLRRFYGRYFGSTFSSEVIAHVRSRLSPSPPGTNLPRDGSWLNFYRETDPVGFPIFEGVGGDVILLESLRAAAGEQPKRWA